jgi:hypothetical protein
MRCRAYATARSIAATPRPGPRPTTAVTYESRDHDETESREALRSGKETTRGTNVRDDRRRAGGEILEGLIPFRLWAAPPGPSILSPTLPRGDADRDARGIDPPGIPITTSAAQDRDEVEVAAMLTFSTRRRFNYLRAPGRLGVI